MVAELRGVKVAQFSDFDLFFLYKNSKMYLLVTSLQPRAYIAEWLRFFHRRILATSGRAAWNPQTCPNFRLWQMAIPIHNATTRGVRSGPRCLKTRNSEDECTFPPNIFARSPQNPSLGGLSMWNLLYREPSVSLTLVELRRWNFAVIQV